MPLPDIYLHTYKTATTYLFARHLLRGMKDKAGLANETDTVSRVALLRPGDLLRPDVPKLTEVTTSFLPSALPIQ